MRILIIGGTGLISTPLIVEGMRRTFAWLEQDRPLDGDGADEEHDRILAVWREIEANASSWMSRDQP